MIIGLIIIGANLEQIPTDYGAIADIGVIFTRHFESDTTRELRTYTQCNIIITVFDRVKATTYVQQPHRINTPRRWQPAWDISNP